VKRRLSLQNATNSKVTVMQKTACIDDFDNFRRQRHLAMKIF